MAKSARLGHFASREHPPFMTDIMLQDATSADGIVQLAATGDEVAFAQLVGQHNASMARVAYVICGDAEVTRDAVQSAWTIAWRRLRDVKDPTRVRAWLVAIAANETRQAMRRQRRVTVVDLSTVIDQTGSGDPAEGIAVVDLARVLRGLKPEDRELLALRFVAGLTPPRSRPSWAAPRLGCAADWLASSTDCETTLVPGRHPDDGRTNDLRATVACGIRGLCRSGIDRHGPTRRGRGGTTDRDIVVRLVVDPVMGGRYRWHLLAAASLLMLAMVGGAAVLIGSLPPDPTIAPRRAYEGVFVVSGPVGTSAEAGNALATSNLVRLADGRVFMIGDSWPDRRQQTLWDPETGLSASAGLSLGKREQPIGVLLKDGRVLILGGDTTEPAFVDGGYQGKPPTRRPRSTIRPRAPSARRGRWSGRAGRRRRSDSPMVGCSSSMGSRSTTLTLRIRCSRPRRSTTQPRTRSRPRAR